jgi:peptide/nickel transport system ATP-binding protein
MTEPLLTVEALSAHSLGAAGTPILRNVSLSLGRGKIMGLIGESGAGKSTLAKAILGILPAGVAVTQGHILFEGRDLAGLSEKDLRRFWGDEIALIPQDPMTALNPARRISAQITDGLRLRRGLSTREAEKRALALLEEVQIREPQRVLRAYPHQLSGGMRQRVLIASAFALEPKLIIADEPTTALDVTVQKQILRLIKTMQAKHGNAVLFVTHDLGVVAKLCDEITLLYMGKVVAQGETRDVLTHAQHPYIRALLAACPRYDRPSHEFAPVPERVFDDMRAEIRAEEAAR